MLRLIDADDDATGISLFDLIQRYDLVDDQVRLIAPSVDGTDNQYDRIRFNQVAVVDVVIRPQDTADRTVDIFQVKVHVLGRCTGTTVLGVGVLERREHSAHTDLRSILEASQFGRLVRTMKSQLVLVLCQRVAAEIEAQDLFLHVEQLALFEISTAFQFDFDFLFLLTEQRQLTRFAIGLFLLAILDGFVDGIGKLSSIEAKAVQGSRGHEALERSRSACRRTDSLAQIVDTAERTFFLPLSLQRFAGATTALNRGKAKMNLAVFDGKVRTAFVDAGRNDLDPHATAILQMLDDPECRPITERP